MNFHKSPRRASHNRNATRTLIFPRHGAPMASAVASLSCGH